MLVVVVILSVFICRLCLNIACAYQIECGH